MQCLQACKRMNKAWRNNKNATFAGRKAWYAVNLAA